MAHLNQDSLFSLEVVVDTLSLQNNVTCRFPAVAFRLLDFPTLLTYHVEPDLGETIKNKINADPHYQLPKQLSELQDKNGKFLVKKGKSCLFKVPPNTLQTHLQNTPLYVMVIDTYPKVPKLVASCTVPLDACMENVYDDICEHGISAPSAHGERGDYQLCNLMGRDSGSVILGVRLLSLGVGLLSHLPEKSVATLQKKGTVSTTKQKTQSGQVTPPQDQDVVLYDIGVAEKPVQVSMLPDKADVGHFQMQTEREDLQNAATQTKGMNRMKQIKKVPNEQLRLETMQDEMNEFFISNTEHPPTLYFNSETSMQRSESLMFSHYPQGLFPQQGEIIMSDSDNDTIRQEDTFSDPEVDSEKLFKPRPKKFTSHQTDLPPKKPSAPQKPQVLENFSNLPILNALLQEISALQGVAQSTKSVDTLKAIQKAAKSPRGKKIDHLPEHPERLLSPGRKHYKFPKETAEEFSSRMSSPRHMPPGKPAPRPSSPLGTHKHSCEAGQHEVQKVPAKTINKGWIRSGPKTGTQKTKLQPGMTHSQKLRLAKSNPALLQSLEKEEDERQQQRRENMKKKWSKMGVFTSKTDTSVDDSGRRKQQTSDTDKWGYPRGLQHHDIPPLDLDDSIDLRHHKKPVPTPRLSLTGRDLHEELHSHGPVPPITPRRSKQGSLRTEFSFDEGLQMIPQREESDPSVSRIDVHVPSASSYDDEGDSDATSLRDSEDGGVHQRPDKFGKTQVLYSPGFPLQTPAADDFDVSTAGQEPELKRVVDEYSDDSDQGQTATHGTLEGLSAGEELGLRCIVDKYSDETSSEKSSHSSYKSAQSRTSEQADPGRKSNLKVKINTLPNPSMASPALFEGSKPLTLPTRQPFTAVSFNDAMSGTQDSTAYIRRSQLASQISMDSTKSGRSIESPRPQLGIKPHPSPRTPRAINSSRSIHTESISSYVPSDIENTMPLSPGGNDEYSDNFDYSEDEDHEDEQTDTVSSEIAKEPLTVKDLKLAPEAKFGYTWGGY